MTRPKIAVALVHHPVCDRRGDIITTAVTNLDLHDIARICRTYNVGRYYVVTPVAEQQRLVQRLLDHWCSGYGATHNPDRRDALELIEVVDRLDDASNDWQEVCGRPVTPVLTGARSPGGIGYRQCREMADEFPLLLVFGTGSGLAPPLFEQGWPVLDPIYGGGEYNHLSVRAAVAIIIDRLLAANDRAAEEINQNT